MSHSYTSKGGTIFHHNPDLSGDVTVMRVCGDNGVEVSLGYDVFNIPGAALVEFMRQRDGGQRDQERDARDEAEANEYTCAAEGCARPIFDFCPDHCEDPEATLPLTPSEKALASIRDLADYQEGKKARWLTIPIEMARDLEPMGACDAKQLADAPPDPLLDTRAAAPCSACDGKGALDSVGRGAKTDAMGNPLWGLFDEPKMSVERDEAPADPPATLDEHDRRARERARKHIETARGADLDAIGTRAGCRRGPGLPDAQYRQAIKDVQRQQRGPGDGEKRVSVRQPGTTHEVTGCQECDFRHGWSGWGNPFSHCSCPGSNGLQVKPPYPSPPPDECPLRAAPVTVRLRPDPPTPGAPR